MITPIDLRASLRRPCNYPVLAEREANTLELTINNKWEFLGFPTRNWDESRGCSQYDQSPSATTAASSEPTGQPTVSDSRTATSHCAASSHAIVPSDTSSYKDNDPLNRESFDAVDSEDSQGLVEDQSPEVTDHLLNSSKGEVCRSDTATAFPVGENLHATSMTPLGAAIGAATEEATTGEAPKE
ncbi:hypothetical protein BDW74DRAFT_180521 [Aspergillus multicolor]|uniref:uncharacterized protein n=1 Tax=Aspergillus multicolor TaxID=41759 RepID=UPI003CCDC236